MMKTTHKLSAAFWASGAAVITGILLLNFSVPVSLIVAGVLGLAFTLGWFIEYNKERP